MAAMDDEEWDWLMYHLNKWSQEEWEAWLPTQSEATQAYYHSWNRRQNDVLVRLQQSSGTAGDGHQQEAAAEAAPGRASVRKENLPPNLF